MMMDKCLEKLHERHYTNLKNAIPGAWRANIFLFFLVRVGCVVVEAQSRSYYTPTLGDRSNILHPTSIIYTASNIHYADHDSIPLYMLMCHEAILCNIIFHGGFCKNSIEIYFYRPLLSTSIHRRVTLIYSLLVE